MTLKTCLTVFMFITLIGPTALAGGVTQKNEIMEAPAELAPFIMTEREMTGMKLTWQTPASWTVTGLDGRRYSALGTRQEWTYEDGFKIYINYNVLNSKDDIYNNILTHPLIAHGQYREGSFSDASIGDMSWVSDEMTCKFILAARGRYLALAETECSWMTEKVKLEETVLEGIVQGVLNKLPR